MSDIAQLWWTAGSTLGALALAWAYASWDLRRFRRRLAAEAREKQRLHDEAMQRQGEEFCAWTDDFLAQHFKEFPIRHN